MVLSRCRREGVCSPWKEYKNLLFCKSNLVMTKSLHYFIQLGSKRVISFLSQAHAHVTCDQTPLPLPPSLLPFVVGVGVGGGGPDSRLMLTRPHTFPKVTLIDQANFKIDIYEPVSQSKWNILAGHYRQGSRESDQRGRLDTTGSSKMAPGDSWWEAICLLVLHVLRRSVGRNECQDSHVLFLDAFRFYFVFKIIPEPL